jgi:hypothetical protein
MEVVYAQGDDDSVGFRGYVFGVMLLVSEESHGADDVANLIGSGSGNGPALHDNSEVVDGLFFSGEHLSFGKDEDVHFGIEIGEFLGAEDLQEGYLFLEDE